MESKKMMGKEVAFMKKKGAPSSMIKHEKAEMGMKKGGMARGGMPPEVMAAMMAKRAAGPQPMRRPQPGGMPPPAQPPMGMKKGGMAYAKGGVVDDSKDDSAETLTASTLTDAEHRAHNLKFYPPKPGETFGGAQTGRVNTKYKQPTEDKKTENAERMTPSNPVRGRLMGGESLPSGHYRLNKGGGIESRGKTKGTVIRMAAGGSVSRRADGIAQRGKTKFTNY